MKTNYAFDFAAEIISDKEFHEIPIEDLVAAISERLARVKESQEREAFGLFDSYEDEHLGDGE